MENNDKINRKVLLVAKEYLDRRSGRSQPVGSFSAIKGWYPDGMEECSCCKKMRAPSKKYPNSLMSHCRTLKHIVTLHRVSQSKVSGYINKYKHLLEDNEVMKICLKLNKSIITINDIKSELMILKL